MGNMGILDYIDAGDGNIAYSPSGRRVMADISSRIAAMNLSAGRTVSKEIFIQKLIEDGYNKSTRDMILKDGIICFHMNMGGKGMAVYSVDKSGMLSVRQKGSVRTLGNIEESYGQSALEIYKSNPEFIFVR